MSEWIKWNGEIDPSDEPVRGLVKVKFRDGSEGISYAYEYFWAHDNDDCDIIAYRIINSEEVNNEH